MLILSFLNQLIVELFTTLGIEVVSEYVRGRRRVYRARRRYLIRRRNKHRRAVIHKIPTGRKRKVK